MINLAKPKTGTSLQYQFSKLASRKAIGLSISLTVVAILTLSACSSLLPANVPPPMLYSFDAVQTNVNTKPIVSLPAKSANAISGPTLTVSIPRAAAGFDTQQMMYMRQPHQLEYFRESQWVDTPAAMLLPLAVNAIEQSGRFGAVMQSPTTIVSQYRLDLEVVRLQQEFFSQPSRVHFTLRAHLSDIASHKIIAWREFDTNVNTESDNSYGGVVAANQAIRTTLIELASFCADTLKNSSESSAESATVPATQSAAGSAFKRPAPDRR